VVFLCVEKERSILKKFDIHSRTRNDVITIIKARGVKGQSLFQGLYLKHFFKTLVYISIYVSFFTPNFPLHAYFLFQFFGFKSFKKIPTFFHKYIFKNSKTFCCHYAKNWPTKKCWLHIKIYLFIFDYILILYHVYYVSMHAFHHIKVNNFCE